MINIIVVEDNTNKKDKIKNLILSSIDISLENIAFAENVKIAKRLIYEKGYDLMILDLVLPLEENSVAKPENGLNFLKDIHSNPQIKAITHIVGLTGFSEYLDHYQKEFANHLWQLIDYKAEEFDWQEKLKNMLYHLAKTRLEFLQRDNLDYQYDIAIVAALQDPELTQVLSLDANWEECKFGNDATNYYKGIFKNKKKSLNVIACSSPQMGMVAASVASMKIIHNFRPRYIIMVGIAAGIKGKTNFGDILIADQSYDGTSGKIKTNEQKEKEFQPNHTPITLDADLKEKIRSYQTKSELFYKIKESWQGNSPSTSINLHIGPLVSVPYVIQHKDELKNLTESQRKLIGLEMETFGVFYSAFNGFNPKPKALSIKAVCDFGDADKSDDFQKFASYVSARFMYEFVLNEL